MVGLNDIPVFFKSSSLGEGASLSPNTSKHPIFQGLSGGLCFPLFLPTCQSGRRTEIVMSNDSLSEEEMRAALFGASSGPPAPLSCPVLLTLLPPEYLLPQAGRKGPAKIQALLTKLRVTLRVTKAFEGFEELVVYDADTLSTILAEQQAKAEAKKKKFRYFELVEVKAV